MSQDFKLFTYKDYNLLITSITKKSENSHPDLYQELFCAICRMENNILNNKVKIRNNNLFNYIYGYILRVYTNFDRNYINKKKNANIVIIDKDITELYLEDSKIISEEIIVEDIYFREELEKYTLTEEENIFYYYYLDPKYNKKSIKLDLNLDEKKYNKIRCSIRYKLKERNKKKGERRLKIL